MKEFGPKTYKECPVCGDDTMDFEELCPTCGSKRPTDSWFRAQVNTTDYLKLFQAKLYPVYKEFGFSLKEAFIAHQTMLTRSNLQKLVDHFDAEPDD